jgi:hypothetical protein
MCTIPHSQLYKVHGCKPRMLVDLPLWSPHSKMYESVESFAWRVHHLYFEIIKHIQANNKQYKFWADFLKYHDIFNVRDYFMIQIILEECLLEISHKLQVLSARSFKSCK